MKKILLPLVLAMSCTFASSQQIPSTPIKVIMPQSSASGLGLVFRLIDAHAQQNNITLIPVFKPGGSGKIGLDYTATASDYYIGATKKDIDITLPLGIVGKVYIIKNQVSGNIEVKGTSGQKIDTASDKTLGTEASIIVVFDGTRWNII
jgi:hypothetical protein